MSKWEENEVFIPRANEIYDKQAEFTKRSFARLYASFRVLQVSVQSKDATS